MRIGISSRVFRTNHTRHSDKSTSTRLLGPFPGAHDPRSTAKNPEARRIRDAPAKNPTRRSKRILAALADRGPDGRMVLTILSRAQTRTTRDAMDSPSSRATGSAPAAARWNPQRKISTRYRPARTGADARIEGSGAIGEMRLAPRPCGSKFKLRFPHHRY